MTDHKQRPEGQASRDALHATVTDILPRGRSRTVLIYGAGLLALFVVFLLI